MSNLFLFTFVMLIITFFIGFFVALIIKIIASWADLLDFCQLHREELAEIKEPRNYTIRRCPLRFNPGERSWLPRKINIRLIVCKRLFPV